MLTFKEGLPLLNCYQLISWKIWFQDTEIQSNVQSVSGPGHGPDHHHETTRAFFVNKKLNDRFVCFMKEACYRWFILDESGNEGHQSSLC